MTPGEPNDESDFVQSFARGLAVIRAFDAEHLELTLADVAKRVGIPAASTRRFLRTLETLGYVRTDGRLFTLTPRVLELGFSYLSALSLPETIQPHLEKLSLQVHESVSAAVLYDAEIVYVARVPTRRIMSVGITIGTRFPAFATSMGRVLLAQMSDSEIDQLLQRKPVEALTERTVTSRTEIFDEIHSVRAQGWALVDGELEIGLRSIAAPLRGRDGSVVAAVNISMSASSGSLETLTHTYLPLLLATARDIELDLKLMSPQQAGRITGG